MQTCLLGLLLVLATTALYSPARHHPFVNFDDDTYVSRNPHIQDGVRWETVRWAFTTYYAANWHPLTWLSHAADYQIFHADPAGPHEINIALHALNTLLLFLLLSNTTGFVWRSFMVAALFGLHPVNVESVVWIAERKSLLSLLFFLLALMAYGWYVRKPRVERYVVVAISFALGLLAKPQIITLPFVLLLWDYWPLRRLAFARQETAATSDSLSGNHPQTLPALILEKAPLFLMAAASAIVTMQAQRMGGVNRGLTLVPRLENAVVSYVRYLALAFWPANLAPIYPHPGASLHAWQVFVALVILAAISAMTSRLRRHRFLPTGWLWFLGTLVPMIGIVQVGRQAMADRYAYLPYIGLFLMICWGAAEWAQDRSLPKLCLPTASVLVLVALCLATHRQIGLWSNNVELWTHAVKVTKNNYVAEDSLGEALQAEGKQDEAMEHFAKAAGINPAYAPSRMYLGVYDQKLGLLQDAIAQYQQVIRITDDAVEQNGKIRATALANLGHAYMDLGKPAEALKSLQAAVALNPQSSSGAWLDLGLLAEKSGDHSTAAHAFAEAMKQQPSDVGYVLLARALKETGQPDAAAEAIQHASLLSSNLAAAQQTAEHLLTH